MNTHLEEAIFELCYDAERRGVSPYSVVETVEIVLLTLNDEWCTMFKDEYDD